MLAATTHQVISDRIRVVGKLALRLYKVHFGLNPECPAEIKLHKTTPLEIVSKAALIGVPVDAVDVYTRFCAYAEKVFMVIVYAASLGMGNCAA